MTRLALITGASSGIGLEFAKIHASKGGDLILVARRKELLESIKTDLEKEFSVQVHLIIKDLSDVNAAEDIFKEVQEKKLNVDYLINNAGFGGYGYFDDQPLEECISMINVNVTALVSLTRLFLKQMIEKNEGKILNIASMAGFISGSHHAIYYATKAFVISFSEAIAEELLDTNVTVTVLCPGATQTNFFNVAGMKTARTLKMSFHSARDVSLVGYSAMIKGDVMVIPGIANKVFLFFLRFLPRVIIRKISQFVLGKENRK